MYAGRGLPSLDAGRREAVKGVRPNPGHYALVEIEKIARRTFALPDLRGRIPLHQGNGSILAETAGAEEITLTVPQPLHDKLELFKSAQVARRWISRLSSGELCSLTL